MLRSTLPGTGLNNNPRKKKDEDDADATMECYKIVDDEEDDVAMLERREMEGSHETKREARTERQLL